MKMKILLCQLCCLVLLGGACEAETEPNNTVAQANTLTLLSLHRLTLVYTPIPFQTVFIYG